MHVAIVPSRQGGREYRSYLLRQTYREEGKVKHRTLANLSALPLEAIEAVRAILRDQPVGALDEQVTIERSLPHGHVAAVLGCLRQLGLDRMLASRPQRQRELVVAMIVSRVLEPASKLATTRNWHDSTLASTLGVEDADEDELSAALDWLLKRQPKVEQQLAARHLTEGGLALYELTSTGVERCCCPLASIGHRRDGKRGQLQIEFGLLTDREGCPVAVSVFEGSTGDPATVAGQVTKLKEEFGIAEVVLVGDRGMLTWARIESLKAERGGRHRLDLGPARRPGRVAGPQRRSAAGALRPAEPGRERAPGTQASGWWSARTRRWPRSERGSGRPCWGRPTPSWRRWGRRWRRAG